MRQSDIFVKISSCINRKPESIFMVGNDII